MQQTSPLKTKLRQVWKFIWEDDSVWSWLVNIILAFVLIKFLVYPGLALVLSTSHPIVAVVSGSMEHEERFDDWWQYQEGVYNGFGISKEAFRTYPFHNGFNTGDIMVLKGTNPNKIEQGEVLVFKTDRPDPIIHRVVKVNQDNRAYYYQTKGDNNIGSNKDELAIRENQLVGKAVFRIPYLGWIKIVFVKFLQAIGIV